MSACKFKTGDRVRLRGGWLGALGIEREHYFSHDYGGTDKCWRRGCNAQRDL